MDDVITFADELTSGKQDQGPPWKILIADDEPSVHLVTKLALGDFTFEGRRLELLSAYGEDDTRRILTDHPDVALVLLDVVMDTMDSGFAMVRYIRDTLKNKDLRIIMRTGQSGNAPEDRIIIDYDINDFKDKTELTVAKLRTTMISSLRTYSHLKIIAAEQRRASANRAYLYTIINSLSSVLVTLDLNCRVLLWNDEAQRWTGTTAAEASGRSLFEVAPVFEPLKALFQDLLDGKTTGRIERTSVPLWKGEQVFVHLILQCLPGSNGPEILLRLDDRTEAKQIDEQISRSQKVNAFSVLAAGVAGELAQFLQEASEHRDIREWGPKATGLLERLAQFSPLAAVNRGAVDWEALLRRKVQTSELPPGLTLEFRGSGGPAWVGAQEAGLESVVDQLLKNAVDSMVDHPGATPGGPLQIELVLSVAPLQDEDKIKHPDLTGGPYWSLTVRDHGVGMAPDTVDRVFDPYFTTKPNSQGLGLGLPLVYSLVEGLGGFIEVTSALGSGTQVKVALPAAAASPTPRVAAGPILLCDDEPLMRQVAGKILRHLGYQVLEAQDGATALELFHAHAGRIRLVILDMVLPGIPGINVFRDIHQQRPGLPVLLTSGFGRGEDVEQAVAEGVSGFLQKPYRAETLADAVRAALGQTSG
jgi:PAS domain S-box-containing protein